MSNQNERKSLGRGLSSLLGDRETESGAVPLAGSQHGQTAPIEMLRSNPQQPRRDFDPDELAELAASIRSSGIIQPILVRPDQEHEGHYVIVAGERRWRAAQLAQQHEVPILVRELSDSESLEIALIENIQRQDLNPMEESRAYRQLMDQFGHTQEQLSESLGKSRSAIANLLRLLTLPAEVQEMVRTGQLSSGHARALVGAEDPAALARQVVNLHLSVRQTEGLVKKAGEGAGEPVTKRVKDANTRVLESSLSAALGTRVTLNLSRRGDSGRIVVKFKDLGQLDQLCNLINRAGADLHRTE